MRTESGLIGDYREKIYILLRAIGLRPSDDGSGLPAGILILLNAPLVLFPRKLAAGRARLASYVAAFLIVVSTLPTPAFWQYYCVAIPFLLVGAVALVWETATSKARIAIAAILAATYLWPVPSDVTRYLSSGVHVPGIAKAENAIDFRLDSVRQVSREIDNRIVPGEPVLSLWPGYLLESRGECLPGMETHVGLSIAPRLSSTAAARLRIRTQPEIETGRERQDPCLVVLGNERSMHNLGDEYPPILKQDGYRLEYKLGHTEIYSCKP